jgi:hypothetical protein
MESKCIPLVIFNTVREARQAGVEQPVVLVLKAGFARARAAYDRVCRDAGRTPRAVPDVGHILVTDLDAARALLQELDPHALRSVNAPGDEITSQHLVSVEVGDYALLTTTWWDLPEEHPDRVDVESDHRALAIPGRAVLEWQSRKQEEAALEQMRSLQSSGQRFPAVCGAQGDTDVVQRFCAAVTAEVGPGPEFRGQWRTLDNAAARRVLDRVCHAGHVLDDPAGADPDTGYWAIGCHGREITLQLFTTRYDRRISIMSWTITL